MDEYEELLRDLRASVGQLYDREGNVISPERFMELYADFEYRVVKQQDVGPWWVSTVWIGRALPPTHAEQWGQALIFETMAFGREGTPVQDMETVLRYATEAEAEAGHERLVEILRSGWHQSGHLG